MVVKFTELLKGFHEFLRKCLILYDKFCRHFQKHVFLCNTKYSPPEAAAENCSKDAGEIFNGNHRSDNMRKFIL